MCIKEFLQLCLAASDSEGAFVINYYFLNAFAGKQWNPFRFGMFKEPFLPVIDLEPAPTFIRTHETKWSWRWAGWLSLCSSSEIPPSVLGAESPRPTSSEEAGWCALGSCVEDDGNFCIKCSLTRLVPWLHSEHKTSMFCFHSYGLSPYFSCKVAWKMLGWQGTEHGIYT